MPKISVEIPYTRTVDGMATVTVNVPKSVIDAAELGDWMEENQNKWIKAPDLEYDEQTEEMEWDYSCADAID